jgi:hypothetical protein
MLDIAYVKTVKLCPHVFDSNFESVLIAIKLIKYSDISHKPVFQRIIGTAGRHMRVRQVNLHFTSTCVQATKTARLWEVNKRSKSIGSTRLGRPNGNKEPETRSHRCFWILSSQTAVSQHLQMFVQRLWLQKMHDLMPSLQPLPRQPRHVTLKNKGKHSEEETSPGLSLFFLTNKGYNKQLAGDEGAIILQMNQLQF